MIQLITKKYMSLISGILLLVYAFIAVNAYMYRDRLYYILVLFSILFTVITYYIDKTNAKDILQIVYFLIIMLSGNALCLARTYRRLGIDEIIVAILIQILNSVALFILLRKNNIKFDISEIKYWLRRNSDFLIVAVFFLLLVMPNIYNVPMYDSSMYYDYSIGQLYDRFTYRFNNYNDYCLCGHISTGYGLLMMIGQMITPHRVIGCHIINNLLSVITIICIGKIQQYYNKGKKVNRLLSMLVFSVAPVMLGFNSEINLDIPSMWFFIILYCCYLYDMKLWYLLTAWIFTVTKAPNIVYMGFFFLGACAQIIGENKYSLKRFVVEKREFIFIHVALGILWLSYFFSPGRSGWGTGLRALKAEDGIHGLGFTLDNFAIKFVQIFILNFNWIYTVLIIVGIILIICQSRKRNRIIYGIFLEALPLLSALGGVLLFNIFYIDYPNPRYIAVGVGIVYLITMFVWSNISIQTWQRNATKLMLVVVGLVASFASVDVVSNLFTERMPISENTSVYVPKNIGVLGDYVYNAELTYYLRCYEKILSKSEYKDGEAIYFNRGYYPMGSDIYFDKSNGHFTNRKNANSMQLLLLSDDEYRGYKGNVLTIIPYAEDIYYNGGKSAKDSLDSVKCGTVRVYYFIDKKL